MAGTKFDHATNPYPTDFAHEIRIQWMWILAGFFTSLIHSGLTTMRQGR